MNSGQGDKLASGRQVSAQFAAGGSELSDFEYDMRTRIEVVADKYGLSEMDIAGYQVRLDAGERIDLPSVETQQEVGAELVVIDKRPTFMGQDTDVKAVAAAPQKYPEKTYEAFRPILDRILVIRLSDNPEEELLEDGSSRNKRTGLIVAAKYRQHSATGVVLATGKFVILGGQRIPMEEIILPGDWATWGDYNSEIITLSEKVVRELCDAVKVNYTGDPESLRVVRVQDVRGIKHGVEVPSE
jgi:hypothetical protein